MELGIPFEDYLELFRTLRVLTHRNLALRVFPGLHLRTHFLVIGLKSGSDLGHLRRIFESTVFFTDNVSANSILFNDGVGDFME
tara:strand:- start:31 stop:282 length:252 start_codon:yes stop_codon:yes gene_type:complete